MNLAFLNNCFQEPECELDIAGFVKSKFDYEPDLYAKVMTNLKKMDFEAIFERIIYK